MVVVGRASCNRLVKIPAPRGRLRRVGTTPVQRRRPTYRAKRNNKEMIVLDGAPDPGYDEVGEPMFSSDSHVSL